MDIITIILNIITFVLNIATFILNITVVVFSMGHVYAYALIVDPGIELHIVYIAIVHWIEIAITTILLEGSH